MTAKAHTAGSGVLAAIRAAMRAATPPLDALLVPSADEHQSEYTPPSADRRAFITGFTGSAGDALVLLDSAHLWTDGRYWTQAQQQLDPESVTLQRSGAPDVPTFREFLQRLPEGSIVGVDARTMSWRALLDLQQALEPRAISLIHTPRNLVDAAWPARPPAPASSVRAHPLSLAGVAHAEKLAALRDHLTRAGAEAHAISSLDAIAWLFNLRAADIPFNPLFLAHAIITPGRATLFTNADRIPPDVRAALAADVSIQPYERFEPALLDNPARRWWIDELHTSAHTANLLLTAGRRIVERARSPVFAAKARKNPAELAASRLAHLRDACALVQTLRWFERESPSGKLTELDVATRVEADRRAQPDYLSHAFFPIAGAGPNAAIIHYRPTPQSNRTVQPDELFLLDCGAQYQQAATDVTRTLHPSAPSAEQRRLVTLVLRAHIALAAAEFPASANGVQLDALARVPLWQERRDYNHGTGHGVGISVHENPPSVSPRAGSLAPLAPDQILSIEPGIYIPGQLGIRIENLYVVQAADDNASRLHFDPLTLLPVQRSLIDADALTHRERTWLNDYHARVRRELSPHLDADSAAWLADATAAI